MAVSDPDLHWWLTSGAGKEKNRRFELHLSSKAFTSCRRGHGKAALEFHSDYFRVISVSDVTGLKVGWFKEGVAKADMKSEVKLLEGSSPDHKKRGDRKRPLGESSSDRDVDILAEAELPERKDGVAGALKKLRSEVDKDRKGEKKKEVEKVEPGRERRKGDEEAVKKKKKKKEKSGDEEPKKAGNWFGARREPDHSGSESMDTKSDDTPTRARKRRKKRRRAKREDRGPLGVGRKVKFDESSVSSKDGKSEGSEPRFQAAPSDKSRQLQLLEYSQNFPGRLAARLLTKMQLLLAREGP